MLLSRDFSPSSSSPSWKTPSSLIRAVSTRPSHLVIICLLYTSLSRHAVWSAVISRPCGRKRSHYCFRQVPGENNNSIGKISRRPASMSNINTSFDITENSEKLLAGPTPPIPGPMLLKVAATAVNVVSVSYTHLDVYKRQHKEF